MLRFGVIGCGRVVQELHLPAWSLVRDVRLSAICDSSPVALQAISDRHPEARQFKDVDAFLANAGELDFVVLATPGMSHVTIGEQVLEKKLHLICEKPLSLNNGDSELLFRIAERQGVLLTPIHNYRYRHTVRKAFACLKNGVLGNIVTVSVRFRSGSLSDEPAAWARQERQHRILLFDFAYHFIDIALAFLGSVSSVRFVDAEVDSTGLQYVVFGTLHENGSRGVFELMLDASCCRTEIEVMGERWGLELAFFPDGFRMLPRRDTPLHRGLAEARRLFKYGIKTTRRLLPGGVSHRILPHARAFQAFVDALQQGRPAPIARVDVLRTIGLLDEVAVRAYATGD